MIASRQTVMRRATQYLIHADTGELSPSLLYRQINIGFTLRDVQAMLLEITPHFSIPALRRILGKAPSARQLTRRSTLRLNAQQSAVAFMYAQIFDRAQSTFGTRQLAEQWMGQPCRLLDGEVPIEVLDNPFAFRIIENYLLRIEAGIYQ